MYLLMKKNVCKKGRNFIEIKKNNDLMYDNIYKNEKRIWQENNNNA